jgi:hypothetical protein
MLLGLGQVTHEEVDRLGQTALTRGKGSFKYAWCSDRTLEERERGLSTCDAERFYRHKALIRLLTRVRVRSNQLEREGVYAGQWPRDRDCGRAWPPRLHQERFRCTHLPDVVCSCVCVTLMPNDIVHNRERR